MYTPPGTRYTPLGPGTPPWDQAGTSPLGPGRYIPPGTRYVPPQDQAGTPPWDQAGTPPRDQAGTPPRKQIPAYGKRAGGTHPTGMHSCHSCNSSHQFVIYLQINAL